MSGLKAGEVSDPKAPVLPRDRLEKRAVLELTAEELPHILTPHSLTCPYGRKVMSRTVLKVIVALFVVAPSVFAEDAEDGPRFKKGVPTDAIRFAVSDAV